MAWSVETWGGHPDLSFFLDSWHSEFVKPAGQRQPPRNWQRWSNPELDKIIEQIVKPVRAMASQPIDVAAGIEGLLSIFTTISDKVAASYDKSLFRGAKIQSAISDFDKGNTPPADAFWSLSIYEVMPEGGMYFADNALHRYAVGSLSPDLHRNEDGSLDILIQKESPQDFTANWLPAPEGKFEHVRAIFDV